MRRAKWILLLFLFLILLAPLGVLADEDDEVDEGDEGDDDDEDESSILGVEGEDLGNVALYLMIATLTIVVWKPTLKWLRKKGPEIFDKEPREFKRKLGVFNRYYMKVHNFIGLGTAVVGTVHGVVLEWHWTLWAGMAALWILVFSGSMMQWRWPPKEMRKGARLLHLQRTLSVVAIILLFVGHRIVD